MNRLLSLHVADVMGRDVLTVFVHDAIEQAAAAFAERRVSGAPVVDETGRCVGVLTAGDFVRREALRGQASGDSLCGRDCKLVGGDTSGPFHIDVNQNDIVRQFMSSAVQTVRADALLVTAARIMDAEHIHRLIVVDDKGFPVGLISSMDVVAAVINSVDEMRAVVAR